MGRGAHTVASDFELDEDGLQEALNTLIELHGQRGESPAPAPAPIDLPGALPEEGTGPHAALESLAGPTLASAVRLDHPGYLAHMDPPTPWVTWAATLWTTAVNQNLLHRDTAPVARDLESLVIGWLAPHFGMTGGHLVPGSTVANLTALWAAREIAGIRRVVCSTAAHVSVRKAAHLLGLAFEAVPTDDRQRLDNDRLGDLGDAALVVTAGTVAVGAVDPLATAPDAAWLHVDAAWAGPLRLTDRYRDVLDGIDGADSVAISAHKWLYQPKECAVVLFADVARAHDALAFGGGYLAEPNVGLLGSHRAAAVPLLATLLAWGRRGLAARIEADMATADHLCELIADSDRLQLWGPNITGVVAWRPVEVDVSDVRECLDGAFVSLTEIDGETWFRSVAANPHANPDLVVDSVLAAIASVVP
jgi:L-2,4-diaminobutyrate decarboxylase